MFGYIKPYQPELKVKELDFYKSIYCGLCANLKEKYGYTGTVYLSYDIVFAALLKLSLEESQVKVAKATCTFIPFKKKQIVQSETLNYFSDLLILSSYYKLLDDCIDHGWKKKMLSYTYRPIATKQYKKLCLPMKQLDSAFLTYLKEQTKCEQEKVTHFDKIGEPSALCFSKIFKSLTKDSKQKKILERMGYFIGRWVYFMDAWDDLEQDMKENNYNPLILHYNIKQLTPKLWTKISEEMTTILNLSIGEAIACYQLLPIQRYQSILDNIMFLGFQHQQYKIGQKGVKSDE